MKIVFFSPINPDRPTGGVLVIFRCAEILRRAGFDACIAGFDDNIRPIRWFDNTAPVIGWTAACSLPPEDCIYVLPEDIGVACYGDVERMGTRLRLDAGHTMIFAQNRRDLYRSIEGAWPQLTAPEQTLMRHPRTLGVMTVSGLEQRYWQAIYPRLQVWCKPNSVDCALFRPASAKKPIAAFLAKPGDTEREARHLTLALRHAGLSTGWQYQDLQGNPHNAIARALGEADVFLSLGVIESFGLAAAEAMAAGCITIGYHGGVPEEFFDPDWSYPVAPLDRMGYLQAFRQMRDDRAADPGGFEQKRARGRAHIERHFSPERERDALIAIFREAVGRAAG